MDLSRFKKELGALNPEQRQAVETIEGPVMVIAGPGTGKTQILTLRIANILNKTDTNPENILALTFTESATANMRRRLTSLIGTPSYYINIHTFHGFCNKLIQDYPENFPKIIGSTNANQVDQIQIIRKIIDEHGFKNLKPFGSKYYYVTEILKNIRQLKSEGIGPVEFKNITSKINLEDPKEEKNTERLKELSLVYKKYQAELSKRKLYDFEDMILETINSLKKDKDFLLDLQEKYQYILVDEHQDTNGAQNKALELLTNYDENPNLFVVGDEKQAIYRFQGASLENFLYFKEKFKKAKLVELKQNYRSTQKILDASHSLIKKNIAVLALTKLQAQKGRTDLPRRSVLQVATCATPEIEYLFITQKIKELLRQKVEASKIAILYRENKDAFSVSDFLTKQNIKHGIESDENILEDMDIKKLNILFDAIENFPSLEFLAPALHLDFLNINPLEAYKAIESKDFNSSPNVSNLFKKIGELKKYSRNNVFVKFFEKVINDTGFLKNILAEANYNERLNKLHALFSEVKKINFANHNFSLPNYLNHLEILREHNLPIQIKTKTLPANVRLMTAHRAKGLEFDYVFIIGAYNGHWGNKRNMSHIKLPIKTSFDADKIEKNEDERRLFYMAITRAKKEAYISYSTSSFDGKEQVPSQFINEIDPALKEEHIIEQNPEIKKIVLASISNNKAPKTNEKTFVVDIFLRRGFSPTSLNNYLTCPWNFFYNNLLRIPKAQANYLIYGNAKHKALQLFFDEKEKNKKIGSKFIIEKFIEDLRNYPLIPKDHETLLKKGIESLTAYYNFYKDSWPEKTVNEYNIKGVSFNLGAQEIKLSGKLDRLELKPNSPAVTVVDYKTGAAKSRNEILGNTKNADGNYFRQLVFYKLLLDMLPNKKYNMLAGAIDFTEPLDSARQGSGQAARGKPAFKREVFEISNEETKALKETITKCANEILNLKFWNKLCGEKDCEYCELRKLVS
ncbi:MAG: ATP-dependent DNA helicase [bacterium]|nr:ATP-dependent DNA helicase [bacterium]